MSVADQGIITDPEASASDFLRQYSNKLTAYHGTSRSAAEKINKAGFWNRSDVQLYGPGVYATLDREKANRYASMKGGTQSQVLELNINPQDLVDLGNFPKGESTKINSLYDQARELRKAGKSVLIKNTKEGDMLILDPELATRSLKLK